MMINFTGKKYTWKAIVFSMCLSVLVLPGCDAGNKETIKGNDNAGSIERDTAAINDSIATYNDRRDRDTANKNGSLGYYTMLERDSGRLGMDPEYTLRTLDSLVRAMEVTAMRVNYKFGSEMDALGTNIGELRNSTDPLASSQSIKNTFMTVLGIFRSLQEEKYPQLKDRIDDVEEKVKVIDESKSSEQQKDKIKDIFHEMEDLIREMNDEVEEEVKS